MTIEPVSLELYDRDFDRFSAEIGAAFERYGFAVLGSHGLDQALVDGAVARTKAFFALPEALKRRYLIENGGGQRGYTPFGIETAKGAKLHDLKEFWHVGRTLPLDHPYRRYMPDNVWPQEIEGFETYVGGLFDALDGLGKRVLRAVARHLGLQERFFDEPVRLGNSILRLLH